MSIKRKFNPAFTIVELLVVIVVIGILATVTIVSYTGITNKAILASLSSDLDGASRQLKLFQTINGNYPATVSIDCVTTPDTITNKCLKLSSGNTVTSLTDDYSVNNTTNPQTFSLTIKNISSSTIAVITDNSRPSILIPAPLSPVAYWFATYQGDHYGGFYDSVTKQYATVTRSTPKTIYDPATKHIYDVPSNKLGVTPRSDGKNGAETVVEEGRTNYLINSYFNDDTNSDGLSDSWYDAHNTINNPTYSRPSSSLFGSQSQRLQYTGVTGDSGWIATYQDVVGGTFSAGDSATFSTYIKGSISGCSATLMVVANDSGYNNLGQVTSSSISLSDTWQRVSVTYSNLPTNTYYARPRLWVSSIGSSCWIDVTMSASQLEKGAFATSYIPTTTTSVNRNSDKVTVSTSNWNANSGTVVGVVDGTTPTQASHLFSWMQDWNNYIRIYETTISRVYGDVVSGGSAWSSNVTKPDGMATTAMKWSNGGPVTNFINGIPGTPSVNSATPSNLPATAEIGSIANGTQQFNSPIQRLSIYNSALSDADILSVTNAIKDGP